jgi:transcriptional regulator with XRE-family HTH domain
MERIRQLRNEKGLSQAKLAVRADMDPATLNRLEQGKGNPNLKTLERVAEALGVEVTDLLENAPRRSSSELSLFNGIEDEWRSSRFAEAIVATADKCAETMGAPDTDPKVVAGMVDALTALHETIMAPMQDEQYRQTLTEEEGDEIFVVLKKLLEAASAGVRRLEDAAEDAEQEQHAKEMREQIRERTSRLSA